MTEDHTVTAPVAEGEAPKENNVTKEDAQKGDGTTKNTFASYDFDALELTMPVLLKAGVHFGHQKARRNPKMSPYVFTTRNNISIIDLAQTVGMLQKALDFMVGLHKDGKQILFVGTKKQARSVVIDAATFTKHPFVVDRWLGGTFTNFPNIRRRVRHMLRLEEMIKSGDLKKYTKFEQMKKIEEAEKMQQRMGGIADMRDLPAAIFITDVESDRIAVREAIAVGVPIIALVDTNVNPDEVTFPIPANDDAVSSLTMILAHVCKALR